MKRNRKISIVLGCLAALGVAFFVFSHSRGSIDQNPIADLALQQQQQHKQQHDHDHNRNHDHQNAVREVLLKDVAELQEDPERPAIVDPGRVLPQDLEKPGEEPQFNGQQQQQQQQQQELDQEDSKPTPPLARQEPVPVLAVAGDIVPGDVAAPGPKVKLDGRKKASYESLQKCPKRDFDSKPVILITNQDSGILQDRQCSVPCKYTSSNQQDYDARVQWEGHGSSSDSSFSCRKSLSATMENVVVSKPPGSQNFWIMNVDLTSDVPVPYFSWNDYKIFDQTKDTKITTAHAAAFISNCGSPGRNAILRELMANGVIIDSYGSCMNNKAEGARGPGSKLGLARKYKFLMALENSERTDYVTEKLYQAYQAGTVPIAWGADNIHLYQPNNNSMLAVKDFPDVKALAERIKYLATHDDEYNEMLKWKNGGVSDSFKALFDINAVHSQCRLCLKLADQYTGSDIAEHRAAAADELLLFVRERGTYYFRAVYVKQDSVGGLHSAVMSAFEGYTPTWVHQRPHCYEGKFRIYRILPSYQTLRESLVGTSAITTDSQVQGLAIGARLDVIFLEVPNGKC